MGEAPLPRPLNPAPFLGYLTLYIEDTRHKVRYPKKGVGLKGLGKRLLAKKHPPNLHRKDDYASAGYPAPRVQGPQ